MNNWEVSHSPDNAALALRRKSNNMPGYISIKVANFTGNKASFMNEFKMNPEKFVKPYKQRFPSAELSSNGETSLGGLPGYFLSVIYKMKNLNTELDMVSFQIFSIKSRLIYLVTFETPLISSEETINEFESIVDSFKFLK